MIATPTGGGAPDFLHRLALAERHGTNCPRDSQRSSAKRAVPALGRGEEAERRMEEIGRERLGGEGRRGKLKSSR